MSILELFDNKIFPSEYSAILDRVKNSPVKYVATRNYNNGSVSYLSAYISGVLFQQNLFLIHYWIIIIIQRILKNLFRTCMERLPAISMGFKGNLSK